MSRWISSPRRDSFQKIGPKRRDPIYRVRLLRAFVLYGIGDACSSLFINAFLWRTSSQDMNLVAMYNLVWFAGLSLGFYLIGHLLRKFLATHLYAVSCIVQGLVLLSLIFFPHPQLFLVIIYGILSGTASGMWYANHHFLVLLLTKSENRICFNSLEQSFGTIVGMIIPPLAGFFITFGLARHLPSYPILFLITSFFYAISGLSFAKVPIEKTSVPRVTIAQATRKWNLFRLFMATKGFSSGVAAFLPTLLILIFLGKEDILGTINALISLLSTLMMYLVAKKVNVAQRPWLFIISIGMALGSTILFSLAYSRIGFLCFYTILSLSGPLSWTAIGSLGFDLTDDEHAKSDNCRYAYLFDQEFYLNLGRDIAIAAFIIMLMFFSTELMMRFSMLIFACTQPLMLFLVKKIDQPE